MDDPKAPMTDPGLPVTAVAVCDRWVGCSTPNLAADSDAKRLVDRLLPRSGWATCSYFVAVAALLSFAGQLPVRGGLAVTAASLSAGVWCSVNFWRCRQAHCVVTGAGWLVLAVVALVGAALGHSVIGGAEDIVFGAVLLAGALFELGWYASHRSHAIVTTHPGHPDKTAQ